MEYHAKHEIKSQIKKGLRDQDLIPLCIDQIAFSKDFEWKKEGEEFVFKGRLYDIVKTKNGVTYCINDKQEERLFANIDQLLKQYFSTSEKKKQGLQQIASIFFGEYTLPDLAISISRFCKTSHVRYFLQNEGFLSNHFFSFWRPPVY